MRRAQALLLLLALLLPPAGAAGHDYHTVGKPAAAALDHAAAVAVAGTQMRALSVDGRPGLNPDGGASGTAPEPTRSDGPCAWSARELAAAHAAARARTARLLAAPPRLPMAPGADPATLGNPPPSFS